MNDKAKVPKASIIIVNYNGGDYIERCVEAVLEQTEPNFECFIMDNGSTDGSLVLLPKLDDRFQITELGDNLGFAAANNRAAEKAKADWIVLLNPDAFAHTDWLEILLQSPQLAKNVTMAGSRQNMALEPGVLDGIGDCYHAFGLAYRAGCGHPDDAYPIADSQEVFGPCGAAALYHRETYLRLGGLDERFFTYHEDVDIAYRMRRDGGICIQNNLAIVEHVSSGITGRASDFAVYYGTRNRIWTFLKNTPRLLLPVLLPAHIATNLFTLTWSSFRKGRFKPTFRGVKDGFFKYRWGGRIRRKTSIISLMRHMTLSPIKVYKRRIPSAAQTSPQSGMQIQDKDDKAAS